MVITLVLGNGVTKIHNRLRSPSHPIESPRQTFDSSRRPTASLLPPGSGGSVPDSRSYRLARELAQGSQRPLPIRSRRGL